MSRAGASFTKFLILKKPTTGQQTGIEVEF